MRASLLLAASALAGCAHAPLPLAAYSDDTHQYVPPMPPAQPSKAAPDASAVTPGIQYLYGSGEAAAASAQAWNGLTAYAARTVKVRPTTSVVLAPGATLADPRFVPCGAKPLAAVFDVDETVLLNRGFEYDAASGEPFSEARWRAYEITGATTAIAVPGAKPALDALRRMRVTVIFNTNRSAANADANRVAIERAGLGPAVHGETLYLKGDIDGASGKDARRAAIAAKYCVIAMGGDQLGDFSDLFNAGAPVMARRASTQGPAIARLWGAGWFVLPNPVYGSALKGARDEIFPPDARWAPEP